MPSKLEQLQLQFRQRLMQEKEERMIKIHTNNQQKALNKVSKYDPPPPQITLNSRKPPSPMTQSPTKKNSPGVDRSRPLPPISREYQQPVRSSNGYYQSSNRNHHHSSNCSEPSARVPVHNGMRARSVDSQMDDGIKRNARTNNYSSDIVRTGYDRKSPENEVWTHTRQYQRSQGNLKLNHDTGVKVSNNSGLNNVSKSSEYSKVLPGRKSSPPPAASNAATVIRNKPVKTSMVNGVKKSTHTVSKPSQSQQHAIRGKGTSIPARKPPNPNQEQCKYCSRNFNKDRIDKHVSICSKTFQKKIKVFDATKMRVQGTEAESYVRKSGGATIVAQQQKPKKKTNWKKQHEDFINAIRQAKMAQRHLAAGGKLSDLPPPPPSDTSDYVPCPYCGRKFNEGAAQRHIPKCKNIISNKKTFIKKK